MNPEMILKWLHETEETLGVLRLVLLAGLISLSLWSGWLSYQSVRKWCSLGLTYPWYQFVVDYILLLWALTVITLHSFSLRVDDTLVIGGTLFVLLFQSKYWTPEKLERMSRS